MLGRTHPVIRRVRALRRDARRREEEGVFLAEGIHLAQEALRAGAGVELALVSSLLDRVPEGREIRLGLEKGDIPIEETSESLLDSLQDARSPQPILLVVRRIFRDPVLEGRPGVPLIVVAHGVQDPGNLGSILRTAHAAGATGFIATGDGADLYHPRAVRATMGSIFRLPAWTADPGRVLDALRERGIARVAADAATGVAYDRRDFRAPTALFLGREGSGLPRELVERLDGAVRIPLHPGVDSLSVGAAAAVLLFEAARQRGLV